MYIFIKYHNNTIKYDNGSDTELSLYNFGEEDPNYNNRSVRNYAYSSFKNLECCHVKKYTGVDLFLNSDSQPNAKLMLHVTRMISN